MLARLTRAVLIGVINVFIEGVNYIQSQYAGISSIVVQQLILIENIELFRTKKRPRAARMKAININSAMFECY